MSKIAIGISLGIVGIVAFFVATFWPVWTNQKVPFPEGYVTANKPSIYFEGHRDRAANKFFYDLVIEDIAAFVVLKNYRRRADESRPFYGMPFIELTKGRFWRECNARNSSPTEYTLTQVSRHNHDLLNGKCVMVRFVDQKNSDLVIRQRGDYWEFTSTRDGRRVAGAHRSQVRRLFADRLNIALKNHSTVFDDTFDNTQLLQALRGSPQMRNAAMAIISRRVRSDDWDLLVPETTVKKPISKEVTESLLDSFNLTDSPDIGDRLSGRYLNAVAAGVSEETSALIYPKLVDVLYKPFKASNPHGPWFYGERWKKQIRNRRPELEEYYVRNDYVPYYAAANDFKLAAALVLKMGQPYIQRFYEEFKTEIQLRVFKTRPGFHTAVLAMAERNPEDIIDILQRLQESPNRFATIWAILVQSGSISDEFLANLKQRCRLDEEYLNDKRSSKDYLGGQAFCKYFFADRPSAKVN